MKPLFSRVLMAVVALVAGCSEFHVRDSLDQADGEVEPDSSAFGDASTAFDVGPRPSLDAALLPDVVAPALGDASVDARTDAEALVDVCESAEDQAGLLELGANFEAILQQQGIPCFIQSMGGPGFAMCIANALTEYVSEACALCVGQQADCLVSNCLGSCLEDQGGDACLACVCDAGCVEAFEACSGVDFGLFACPEP